MIGAIMGAYLPTDRSQKRFRFVIFINAGSAETKSTRVSGLDSLSIGHDASIFADVDADNRSADVRGRGHYRHRRAVLWRL